MTPETMEEMTCQELRDRIASAIRAWLDEEGVSARALSRALGMSSAAACRWTTGRSLPRTYELRCLCEHTGLSADDLLGLR